MGQAGAKSSSTENNKWKELKAKQITEQEKQQLSERIDVPYASIQKAVHFLETKRYIVENGLLGKGGSALVMKACTEENDYLAIKFLINPSSSKRRECQQEYDILNQFDSPYVIKVFDLIQEENDGVTYQIIVMERCAYDLKSYLSKNLKNKKQIPNSQIYKLCLEFSRGLAVLHSKNILHLDIKPGNILFGVDLKWKFADLGIAKVLKNQQEYTNHLDGFTAIYASPEQYQLGNCNQKKSITKASDVYSLGIVFLQMTGVDISSKWVMQEKLQEGNYERFLNPNFEDFNNIIKQMIRYQPNERCEIEEIIILLKALIKRHYNSQESEKQSHLLKKVASHDVLDTRVNQQLYIPMPLASPRISYQSDQALDQADTPKRKIVRIYKKPSLTSINAIQQSTISSDVNLLSPQENNSFNFNFNFQKQSSGSTGNTPILPKISQNGSYNFASQLQHTQSQFNLKNNPSQAYSLSGNNTPVGQTIRERALLSPTGSISNGSQFLQRKKQQISALNVNPKFNFDSYHEENQPQMSASFKRIDSPLIKTREYILPQLKQQQSSLHQKVNVEYLNLNQQYQVNQFKIQRNKSQLKQSFKFDSPLLQQSYAKRDNQSRRLSSSLMAFE